MQRRPQREQIRAAPAHRAEVFHVVMDLVGDADCLGKFRKERTVAFPKPCGKGAALHRHFKSGGGLLAVNREHFVNGNVPRGAAELQFVALAAGKLAVSGEATRVIAARVVSGKAEKAMSR